MNTKERDFDQALGDGFSRGESIALYIKTAYPDASNEELLERCFEYEQLDRTVKIDAHHSLFYYASKFINAKSCPSEIWEAWEDGIVLAFDAVINRIKVDNDGQ